MGCARGRTSMPTARGEASPRPYEPDRREYLAFREGYANLLEPNYLPFMVHRFEGDIARGDDLVFCRWPDGAWPLRVFVEPPVLSPEVQDEFRPIDPDALVAAVVSALDRWEEALEGAVSFERVEDPSQAQLRIRMRGAVAPVPVPGKRVLGRSDELAHACLAHGWDPDRDRIVTTFEMPTLTLYLADEFGLLSPELVRRLALHELGHALGMRGHSPSPGDLMHARLDHDGPRIGLSTQDVNSFLSLYRLAPGTRYGDVPVEAVPARLPPAPPGGPPQLAVAPYVDTRHGYELHLPSGWLRIEEPHGVLATNGTSWDYDASLRIFIWPASSAAEFWARFGDELLAQTWFRTRRELVVFGRPGFEVEVEDASGEFVQIIRVIALPRERVMMLLAEAPRSHAAAWRPWFDQVLSSLEVWHGADRLREGESPRVSDASALATEPD